MELPISEGIDPRDVVVEREYSLPLESEMPAGLAGVVNERAEKPAKA